MTLAYDIERTRMLRGNLSTAASEIQAHNPPDWIVHRCDEIRREAASFAQSLTLWQKERMVAG